MPEKFSLVGSLLLTIKLQRILRHQCHNYHQLSCVKHPPKAALFLNLAFKGSIFSLRAMIGGTFGMGVYCGNSIGADALLKGAHLSI